jgi:NAD(P)-dependent dehydrogenase (short-subunit alcohol dehydrogenase family)
LSSLKNFYTTSRIILICRRCDLLRKETNPTDIVEAIMAETPWTAIVTGGASGIGAATVKKLASRGINVLIADVTASAGHDLAALVKADYGVDAIFKRVDVSNEDDVKAMVATAVEAWGRLDYAANVAGICPDGDTLRNDESLVSTAMVDKSVSVPERWSPVRLEGF